MQPEDPTEGGTPSGGLMQSLRGLAATAVGILQTRLELLATEVDEERVRILQLLVWGGLALLFLFLGLLALSFALVVLFWDTHRLLVITLLALLYLAIGIGLAVVTRARMQRGRPFAATLAELAKDRDHLTPR